MYNIESGKATEVKVKLGERKGAEVEILEGLIPGAQVVTAGQLRVSQWRPPSRSLMPAGPRRPRRGAAREPVRVLHSPPRLCHGA